MVPREVIDGGFEGPVEVHTDQFPAGVEDRAPRVSASGVGAIEECHRDRSQLRTCERSELVGLCGLQDRRRGDVRFFAGRFFQQAIECGDWRFDDGIGGGVGLNPSDGHPQRSVGVGDEVSSLELLLDLEQGPVELIEFAFSLFVFLSHFEVERIKIDHPLQRRIVDRLQFLRRLLQAVLYEIEIAELCFGDESGRDFLQRSVGGEDSLHRFDFVDAIDFLQALQHSEQHLFVGGAMPITDVELDLLDSLGKIPIHVGRFPFEIRLGAFVRCVVDSECGC